MIPNSEIPISWINKVKKPFKMNTDEGKYLKQKPCTVNGFTRKKLFPSQFLSSPEFRWHFQAMYVVFIATEISLDFGFYI